ncbi:peptide-methionine (S)-S-oxide reductase MsrA [Nitratireductor sp. CAU 1489]|uniref:Peptide methionine sulfoxide reductase MsrA n=1 Tax=Nitratireductor arenosus TaxID=2682096 RepID=A0A844QFH0_9HYPH|nr:peptide-methionine (S)-S-oxide reductase MsrA [Nitratireductor arenosus]MVA96529.1 peptide-methionine (S)-S-oxide reductase MsrA [Nitratireductor arenosus]
MIRQFAVALLITFGAPAPLIAQETQTAIFAGGCFWCVESDFDRVQGVKSTVSGYSGGDLENPTYRNHTGHREVVKIEFDPSQTSYRTLADIFFRSVDPTDAGGQFCDRGHAYTTAIYTQGEAQQKAAEEARAEAENELGRKIVTPIESAGAFWDAEGYHQDYYRKNPLRYKYYRYSCGRDDRIEELWGEAAHRGIPAH